MPKWVCDEREVWFEKPERLLGLLIESIKNYGCKTLLYKEDDVHVAQLKCSIEDDPECTAVVKAKMIGDAPLRLRSYAYMASAKGFGRVYVIIEVNDKCTRLCDLIEKLLLRGGG